MKMWSPDEEWQHVFWAPENFPESFIAQWEMQNLHTEAGLTIVFFAATGPNGEDVMDPSLPERDGTFSFYNNDVLSNYHISYYANNPENAKRPQSHLRKNSGKHVVAKGPIGIEHHSTAVHQVTLMKNKNNIVLYVDDREIINWTDDGSINGKVYGAGRIALRQMEWSVFRYRNFRVWSVAEKSEDPVK
uniref:YesU family protein n=1 Tax=Endozoicomonas sp. SESOKO1 TaxID=2828742 RepID=UPI002147F08E